MICAGGFVRWRAPSPLWRPALDDDDLVRFSQPAILRFEGTGFMDELMALVQEETPAFDHLVVRPETAKRPDVGWRVTVPGAFEKGMKLYHPAASRFYLVSAALVCQGPGQPDAHLNPDAGDSIGFVVRRLIYMPPRLRHHPTDYFRELAWIGGKTPGWRPVEPLDVLEGEEQHPLYSLPLCAFDKPPGPEDRYVHVGAIPVQNREAYESVPAELSEEEAYPDPRVAELWDRVLTPMERLRALPGEELAPRISALLLLELAAFLNRHLAGYWERAALQPYWKEVLQQLWPERRAVLAGQMTEPGHDLRALIMEGDLEALSDSVVSLGFEQAAASRGAVLRGATGYYVVRCVYTRFGERPVVSDATVPFALAELTDPEAPPQPFVALPALLKVIKAVKG